MSARATGVPQGGNGLSLVALLKQIETDTIPYQSQSLEALKAKAAKEFIKKDLHILFQVGNQELGVPIQALLEVGQCPPVIPLPNLPVWLIGITHIRGEIISMVDFSLLFQQRTRSAIVRKSYYILLRSGDIKVGFLVDRLTGVIGVEEKEKGMLHLESDELEPTDISSFIACYVQNGSQDVAILDPDNLLTSPLLNTLDPLQSGERNYPAEV